MSTVSKRISILLWICAIMCLSFFTNAVTCQKNRMFKKEIVEKLVRQWAPLVWLAPGEKFLPGSVNEFLQHVHTVGPKIIIKPMQQSQRRRGQRKINNQNDVSNSVNSKANKNNNKYTILPTSDNDTKYVNTTNVDRLDAINKITIYNQSDPKWNQIIKQDDTNDNTNLPVGQQSADWFLVTNNEIDMLLADRQSFVYGQNPNDGRVPVYAIVSTCNSNQRKKNKQIMQPMVTKNDYMPKQDYSRRLRADQIKIENATNKGAEKFSNVTRKLRSVGEDIEIYEKCSDISNKTCASGTNTVTKSKTETKIEEDDDSVPHFHVTYWMFYPFSQGKPICTINLGPFGRLPIPLVFGMCMGSKVDFGSHIGDWEHMTLFFQGNHEPEQLYVSAHDAGAYYSYERLTGTFVYQSQETRKGILQRPIFPKTVRTSSGYHPVMFSAQGSHGLWTAPGKHRFVRVPRLFDINGFGTPWITWKNIEISFDNDYYQPRWLQFNGRWGNPKSRCHPLNRVGLNFCEYIDGPTGIPQKKPHFHCNP